MKKLITLLLVLTGAVCSASATTLHIGLEVNYTGNVYVHYYGGSGETSWGSEPSATYDGIQYGRRWYHLNIGDNTSAIVRLKDNNWNDRGREVTGISGDNCYIYVSSTDTNEWIDGQKVWNTGKLESKGWQTMKFSNNVDGKWDDEAYECTKVDDNTFTYTLTKAQIDEVKTIDNIDNIYFRFKLANGVFFVGDSYWTDHYFRIGSNDDSNGNVSINVAGNITNNSYTTDQQKNWYVGVPSYDYEKLVFTIQDVTSGSTFGNSTWKVSVDAYISKEITSRGIATFGSAAPVDFSKAIPATEGKKFTAKKGKVLSNGTIAWTAATTLAANEGAFLEGDADTYSIPVAASASADTENNDFVAITEEKQIAQTVGDKNAYILSEKDGVVGFYKPASDGGSWCAAGTAYLATNVSPARAREFFPLWDEDVTAVEAVKQEQKVNGEFFNLAGQRVAQPTKGLYIVNGKKYVIK